MRTDDYIPDCRKVAAILEYVHHHCGNKHPMSMLHTNYVIDDIKHYHAPATAALNQLARLINQALKYPPNLLE